jgi:3-oxoadipyl-CoA thiolase
MEFPMTTVYICDYTRTPIGRFGGGLAKVRTDDLAAIPLRAIVARNASLPADMIDEVYMGSANQAGEDNRNVARMASLLAGIPITVPGITLNRLCASGLEAVAAAARAIKAGEAEVCLAGGVESMTRAPFVMGKADSAFSRQAEIFDTTIGWRFVNPAMKKLYGVDSMPDTAENVAVDFNINREDQDAFALRSQQKAESGIAFRAGEITPVTVAGKVPVIISEDEHPRKGSVLADLQKLKPIREGGTVTAGNASGVNDGACALLLASEKAVAKYGLTPIARIVGAASAGVAPRIMGIGPAPATKKLMARENMKISQFDFIELNEAFASQGLATLRDLGVADDADFVNPHGGAIALGHPLGMSGARLVGTLARTLRQNNGKFGLATMCVGVGQGSALAIAGV